MHPPEEQGSAPGALGVGAGMESNFCRWELPQTGQTGTSEERTN